MRRGGTDEMIGTRDRCPHKSVRPEHSDLVLAWREHRAGRLVYPSLSQYPVRMLRQFDILDQEQAAQVPRG